jgi:hypothetical protein
MLCCTVDPNATRVFTQGYVERRMTRILNSSRRAQRLPKGWRLDRQAAQVIAELGCLLLTPRAERLDQLNTGQLTPGSFFKQMISALFLAIAHLPLPIPSSI